MADKMAVDEAKIRLQDKSLDGLQAIVNKTDPSIWSTEAEVQAAKQIIMERTSKAGINIPGELKGVKGWLITFIIWIGVLLPIGTVINISEWDKISDIIDSYSGLRDLSIFDITVGLGVAVIGVYTAISLYKIKPSCVKLAKIFIIVYAVSTIFLCISIFSLDIPQSVKDETMRMMFFRLIVAGLWYAYFMKSKRVKETYYAKNL